jgi:hypothetical protein
LFPAGAFSWAAVHAGAGVIAVLAASDRETDAPTTPATSRHEKSASKPKRRINSSY